MPENQPQITDYDVQSPLDNVALSFKAKLMILGILAFIAFAWMNRYTIVAGQSAVSNAPVYKLDRWTGNVEIIYAGGTSINVTHKNE